jgi:hypothetical protein
MVLCGTEEFEVTFWHLGDEIPVSNITDVGAVIVEQSTSKRPVDRGDTIAWDGESNIFDILLGGLVAALGRRSVMLLSLAASRRRAGTAGGRGRSIAVGIFEDLQ